MFLVIGGSSFIGAYTAQAFIDAGYDVVATGRNLRFAEHYAKLGVRYLPFDLADSNSCEALPSKDIEGVALLAALLPANSGSDLKSDDNAVDYIEANACGTARLLEFCRRNGIPRIIAASSYADVQNRWSPTDPVTEETPRDFKFTGDHAAYVISKNAASDLMRYYNEQHGMRNAVFRLPPVYGVGPHGSLKVDGKVRKSGIQIFIDRAKAGEPITVFGDGSVKRDIVYVKDVAEAFVKAMVSPLACGLYNIGSGKPSSLLEEAEAIARVFAPAGEVVPVSVDPSRDNGLTGYSFDISKAQKDFGYVPRFADFADMMRDWKAEELLGTYVELFQGGQR